MPLCPTTQTGHGTSPPYHHQQKIKGLDPKIVKRCPNPEENGNANTTLLQVNSTILIAQCSCSEDKCELSVTRVQPSMNSKLMVLRF